MIFNKRQEKVQKHKRNIHNPFKMQKAETFYIVYNPPPLIERAYSVVVEQQLKPVDMQNKYSFLNQLQNNNNKFGFHNHFTENIIQNNFNLNRCVRENSFSYNLNSTKNSNQNTIINRKENFKSKNNKSYEQLQAKEIDFPKAYDGSLKNSRSKTFEKNNSPDEQIIN